MSDASASAIAAMLMISGAALLAGFAFEIGRTLIVLALMKWAPKYAPKPPNQYIMVHIKDTGHD